MNYNRTFTWTNPPSESIQILDYRQSDDFLISTIRGTVQLYSIEVSIHLTSFIWAPDPVVEIAVLYGPASRNFDPKSESMKQGIEADFRCLGGGQASLFNFLVDFPAEKLTLVFPTTNQQCIIKKTNFQTKTFKTDGEVHVRLAFYLIRSASGGDSTVAIGGGPDPKVQIVFSVTPDGPGTTTSGGQTTAVQTTRGQTASGQSTTSSLGIPNTPSSGPLALSQDSLNMLPYAAVGGGTLVGLVSAMIFRARRREKGTEIYLSSHQAPGEKGTRIYGQTAESSEVGTRVFDSQEKDRKRKDTSA